MSLGRRNWIEVTRTSRILGIIGAMDKSGDDRRKSSGGRLNNSGDRALLFEPLKCSVVSVVITLSCILFDSSIQSLLISLRFINFVTSLFIKCSIYEFCYGFETAF